MTPDVPSREAGSQSNGKWKNSKEKSATPSPHEKTCVDTLTVGPDVDAGADKTCQFDGSRVPTGVFVGKREDKPINLGYRLVW